ncbi:hypothetical protein CPB83DRAFT_150701 [Crepidotus variabilis]|uniref:Uncharacterized protein n=1 Tax=Crepidotus variabilis TaxID=179855 RepID=A0A9P6E3Z4_9AGAR|nr:hypothetical protein CPB83DRAFT_150701 [Crepidotus variabilis]
MHRGMLRTRAGIPTLLISSTPRSRTTPVPSEIQTSALLIAHKRKRTCGIFGVDKCAHHVLCSFHHHPLSSGQRPFWIKNCETLIPLSARSGHQQRIVRLLCTLHSQPPCVGFTYTYKPAL